MRRKSRNSTLIVILLLVVVAAVVYYLNRRRQEPIPGPVAGSLVIHFLDVGQGDSELIRLPDGRTILIDSGDAGKPTVELLRKLGVSEIDLIIATHPHQDHIGEIRDIMRAFIVKEVWDPGFRYGTRTYREMLEGINNSHVAFHTPRRGESRSFGEVQLDVLHPGPSFISEDRDDANDASIVVRLSFGGKRFLFTGDAELASWRQMIETKSEYLRADLLKAAHHGSSNGMSEDVLDAVRPSIITISCERGNDYHHPHPSVMRVLEQRESSIELYRTDLHGTITATCDGDTINISTERAVARSELYLTGDEVAAGKVASDGRGEGRTRGSRGGRRSR